MLMTQQFKIGDLVRVLGRARLFPVQKCDSPGVVVSIHSNNKWSFAANNRNSYFDLIDELLLVVDICKTPFDLTWWIVLSPTHNLCFALLDNELQPVDTSGNTQDVE